MPNRATIAKAEQLYAKMDSTYDKEVFANVPRLSLVNIGMWLIWAYQVPGSYDKCLNAAKKLLHNLGFRVEVQSPGQPLRIDCTYCYSDGDEIEAAMCAAFSCFCRDETTLARQYGVFAKERYQIMHGNLHGFEQRHGEVETFRKPQVTYIKYNGSMADLSLSR